jgi:ATP-dependent Zn protease
LGARALEELLLGNGKITSGCSSDLQKATQAAYGYIINYGFDDEEGNIITHRNILSDEDIVSYRKYMPNLSKEDHFKIDQRANQLLIKRWEMVFVNF